MNLPAGAAAVLSEYSPMSRALPCRCSFSQYWWNGSAAVVVADRAEAVDVAVADAAPVDELDAELERAAHRAHELDFVDAQRFIEGAQVRHRGFADADDADVFRLDELNRAAAALERVREAGRRHPAGGATTHDDDAFQSVVGHRADCGTVRAL